MSSNPYDFVDAVSYSKEDIIKAGAKEGDYCPFITNRALSYFSDSVLYANEMNVWRDLPGGLQFDYLLRSLRRRKRRAKWHKPADEEAVKAVSWRYGLSVQKARDAVRVMRICDVNDTKSIYKEFTGGE